MSGDFKTSAECHEMKHKWCRGDAWDKAKDMVGTCDCSCHDDAQEDAA